MAKISLLERMRMQRDQRESPEIKELRWDLALAQERYAHSVRMRVQIEQVVSKQVFKPMMERIGFDLGAALLRHIYQGISKNPPAVAQDYYIQIPYTHLMHLDSDSTLSLILQQYKKQKHYPQVEFRGIKDGAIGDSAYRVMEVRIKIPELHYREVVEV